MHYVGRSGESYCDMKDQFPIRAVDCTVADMTEPNLRPQESGNRMDCTVASVSDGRLAWSLRLLAARLNWASSHTPTRTALHEAPQGRGRTGTYVTIQAFQQGIGTGAAAPG